MPLKLSKEYPKKRAFITGAGSGLGEAMALQLAAEGWTLGLTDITQDRVDNIASKVEGLGAKAFPFLFDVSDRVAYEKAAKDFLQYVGVDVLVNNAGVGDGAWFHEYSLENWDWLLGINQMGVIYGCHFFVPAMKQQQSGTIINVASAASFANMPKMTAYNVSKAAVRSLSDTLHAELAPDNVHVSVVMPTFVKTGIMDLARGDEQSKKEAAILINKTKLTPDVVANTILTAAGRKQQYIHTSRQSLVVHWISRVFPRVMSRLRVKVARDAEKMARLAP